MKKNSFLRSLIGLTCFSLIPNLLVALPQSPEIIAGDAVFSRPDQSTMMIEASDRSIINYQSFNIELSERVQFIQPSSSSVVLNRIEGNDGSKILGSLQSNGKVFLVNPNGVYFGPNAQVDMGSLIASTLDISNADFLNDRFAFFMKDGTESSTVENFGTLIAGADGSIALISPNVRNEGLIVADAGKVLLAAGEKVILDFVGNGLMHFAVEGHLEEAMIEQSGSIQALQGQVHLAMSSVGKVMQEVINVDGIAMGNALVEQNGVIRLVSSSSIRSPVIAVAAVEGSNVQVSGSLDVSNLQGQGGSLHIFGENLKLVAANIDASGSTGGGEVLIGGDLFGEGDYFKAIHTSIGRGTVIKADALDLGDGGKVVAWSNEVTRFNGIISSRGGSLGGHGGFVETSGKVGLASAIGYVDTTAPLGQTGKWLLDPATITISNSGTDSLSAGSDEFDLTSNLVINASLFSTVSSNVVLNALVPEGSISIAPNTTLTMAPGYGIQFNVDADSGQIVLNDNSAIETAGGFVIFNGPTVISADNTSVRTDLDGASAPILFTSFVNGLSGSLSNLTLNAGSAGTISFAEGAGDTLPIGLLTVDAKTFELGSSIYTQGQDINISAATVLTGNANFDTTVGGGYSGGNISFLGSQSTIDGPYSVGFDSGSGIISFFGDIGSTQPVSSFKPKGGGVVLAANVTADGNTTIFESAVLVAVTNLIITDLGTSGVFFQSTVDGSVPGNSLTVSAPIGTASFAAAVGSITPLYQLTVSANNIIQNSSVALTNATTTLSPTLSYSAPGSILVGGDVTTTVANGVILINNPAIFAYNTANPAGVHAGAVTLTASTGTGGVGAITLNGAAVGSEGLYLVTDVAGATGTVSLINSNLNVSTFNAQTHIFSQDANSAINASNSVTVNVSNTFATSSLATLAGISSTGGNISLSGGSIFTVVSNLSTTTGNITLTPASGHIIPVSYQGNIVTQGGIVTAAATGAGTEDLLLTGDAVVSLGEGSLVFNRVDGPHHLSLSGSDVASVSLAAAVGSVAPLLSLTATVATVSVASTVATVGAVTIDAPLGIALGGISITTQGGAVGIQGPSTLSGASFAVNTTLSSHTTGANIAFNGLTSTIDGAVPVTLTGGTGGVVTLGGSIGGVTPITSLSVASGAQVNVGSNVTASGASGIAITPAVILTGASSLLASNTAAPVTLTSTVDGFYPLNVIAGSASGTATLGGSVGSTTPLAGLNVSGSAIAVNGAAVTVVGGLTTFNDPTTLGNNVTFTNNGEGIYFLSTVTGLTSARNFTVASPTGTAYLGGAVGTNIGNVSITAFNVQQVGAVTAVAGDSVTYTGYQSTVLSGNTTVSGSGDITITNSATIGSPITLDAGTSGTVSINGVQAGSDGLTINTAYSASPLSTGLVQFHNSPVSLASLTINADTITTDAASLITTVGSISLAADTSIVLLAGLITGGGNIGLSGDAAAAITGNVATNGGSFTWHNTGSMTYNGGVMDTNNGNLTFSDPLTLATTSTTLNVGAGALLFSGALAGGGESLTAVGSSASSVTFTGAVSGLANLTVETGTITQSSTVAATAAITYDATTNISLANNITSSAGAVTITGPTTLTAAVDIITTPSQNITFNTAISTIDGGFGFIANAGTGTVNLGGGLGSKTALTSFTRTGTGVTVVGSNISTTGAIAFTTSPVVLAGDSNVLSSGSTVLFGSTVNGPYNLFVSGVGSPAITFDSTVGATTALKSFVLSGSSSLGGNVYTR